MLRCALVSRTRMGTGREAGEGNRPKGPPVLAQQAAAMERDGGPERHARRSRARPEAERAGPHAAAAAYLRLERGVAEGDATQAQLDRVPYRVVVQQVEIGRARALAFGQEAGIGEVAAIAGAGKGHDALQAAAAVGDEDLEVVAERRREAAEQSRADEQLARAEAKLMLHQQPMQLRFGRFARPPLRDREAVPATVV